MSFPRSSLGVALAVGGMIVFGLNPSRANAQVAVQFHWGEADRYHLIDGRHPLEGRQYQTMASLAHYLDEEAQDVHDEAYRLAPRADRAQRAFLASVSDFTRRAHDVHARLDSYLDSPWDMRKDVNDLTRRANLVSQRLATVRVFEGTRQQWNDVIDVLTRMQQVLAGREVEVPPAHRRPGGPEGWDPHRYDNRYREDRGDRGSPRDRGEGGPPGPGGYGQGPGNRNAGGALDNESLQEFRRLARDLDDFAQRVTSVVVRPGDRDPRSTATVQRFKEGARDIRQRAESNALDPRELRPLVQGLLDDARRTDQSIRQANPFGTATNEWGRAIDLLDRMLRLLPG